MFKRARSSNQVLVMKRVGAGIDRWSGRIALFLVLAAGTAYGATYVVSSNADVGPNTISGHKITGSNHANIIAGSIAAADIVPSFYNEPWHVVADNPKTDSDPCATPQPAVFCGGTDPTFGDQYWRNYGDTFMGARFYRVAGVVHIEGLVMATTPSPNPSIFVLPVGYRPAKDLVFAVDCRNDPVTNGSSQLLVTHGRIDVYAEGWVVWNRRVDGCDPRTYISLSGINFRAEK